MKTYSLETLLSTLCYALGMMESPKSRQELSEAGELEWEMKEMAERHAKDIDAQKVLTEWELEDREKRHADELGIEEKTGLHTYTYLMAKLENALNSVRVGKVKDERANLHDVSLICIDIDNFKQVNDTFGHLAGDEVLQKVANLLKHSVREGDVVARPGGDELVIMLKGPGAKVAMLHAEDLRTKIAALAFDASSKLRVTASFGVSATNGTTDAKELYAEADKALYAAKNAGRNQVAVYS